MIPVRNKKTKIFADTPKADRISNGMKNQFIVVGGKKLRGKIAVKGAKNYVLKLFAAALLVKDWVTITNVPEVEDVSRMVEIVQKLGCSVEHPAHGTYKINASKLTNSLIDPEISKRLRASIVLTGSLLARTGRAKFPYPGGCVIGKRPIDVFLEGFRSMGVEVKEQDELFELKTKKLKSTEYFSPLISVTGTEALLLAAVSVKGKTTLKNCACEPEIPALAEFLNLCGAKISGAGTHTIHITGVPKLKGGTCRVIPDRIETGTFAIMAAATHSKLTIADCDPSNLESLWSHLRHMGIKLETTKDEVVIHAVERISPCNVKTHEYPGFPTDLQAPFCVLLTQAEGVSLVQETIYEERLNWTKDLNRMGANISMLDPHRVEIRGISKLNGRELKSPDLRAGMAYIIAALCAKGKTAISDIYQIDRGYEKVEERLQSIGADIKRV